MRAVLILTRGVQTFKDEGEMLYIVMLYLTRHIYMDHNSGDRNCGSTKIWGFFSEIPKFRTPN